MTTPTYQPARQTLPLARRLVLLAPWLGGGGADAFNLDLLSVLKDRGWDTAVITLLNARAVDVDAFRSVAGRVVIARAARGPWRDPGLVRSVIAAAETGVVFISHSEQAYALLPHLRRWCPGPVYADYCHIEEPHWRGGGHPRFSLDSAAWLDLTLVSSEHLKGWMVAHGGNAARIGVCTTNVDTRVWRPDPAVRERVRRELRVGDDRALILFAGRLTAQKQPRVLAEALSDLARRGCPYSACVAGDGEDAAWFRDYIRERGLTDRVACLGALPRDRIRELMQAADVFFLPSSHEGISVAIYEAMACGAVPVSADVGGQRELVTPDCGVLVARSGEAVEARRYADAIEALIASPARRGAMSAASISRIRDAFDLGRLGDCMENRLEHAHSERAGAPRPSAAVAAAAAVRAVVIGERARWAERFRAWARPSGDR